MKSNVAVISVNNVEVGAMPLEQYEAIVKAVKGDWRTRIASVFSYIGFVWRIILRLWHYFVQGFTIFIAFFMLYSLYHQAELTQLITELRNSPAQHIAEIIRTITNICITSTVIAVMLSMFMKGTPVFVTAEENAINKKIREVMEVPAEGHVTITFKKDEVYSAR